MVVFGLGKNLLFKSVLGHCDLYVSIVDFQKIQIKMLCKIVDSKEARSSSNALVHVFPC